MKTLNTMFTLDDLGYIEMLKGIELLTSYNNAGQYYKGEPYAYLPESWEDSDVYIDYIPDMDLVGLFNSRGEFLISTDYGVVKYYTTSCSGLKGTLFNLAEQVNEILVFSDDNILISVDKLDSIKEDLQEIYTYLDEDMEVLRYTKADLTSLYRCKHNIVYSFILHNFDKRPLTQEDLEEYADEDILNMCLQGFEPTISGPEDQDRYIQFINDLVILKSKN